MAKKRKKKINSLSIKLAKDRNKKIVRLINNGELNKARLQLDELQKKMADNSASLAEYLIYIAERISENEFKEKAYYNAYAVLSKEGERLKKLGRYEEAFEYFEKALHLQPDDPVLLTNCGTLLAILGNYNGAIEKFKTSLKISPGNSETYNNYGNALLEINKLDDAIENFEVAFKINPNNYVVIRNLANIFLTQEKYDKALEKFEIALNINPDDFNVLMGYSTILACIGKYDLAIKTFEHALSVSSEIKCYVDIKFLYFSLGLLYYFAKSDTKGKKYFDLIVENSNEKDSERIRVAQNLFSINPYDQAGVDLLREISENSPQYNEAFDILSLNLSPKDYWLMFSNNSTTKLRDSKMLNQSIYHKIKNEISILKDIVYEIISDYYDKDNSIFQRFIENINYIIKGIEDRRNKEKEKVEDFPENDYTNVIKVISDTAHDVSDFVNNELAVIEADVRDVISDIKENDSCLPELEELLNQIKITQGALNDLKSINEGIKIKYSRFPVEELFENWANTRKLRHASINLNIENGESEFNGDKQKIKSFLNELVENSLKHNENRKYFKIKISSKDVVNPPEIRGKDILGQYKFLHIQRS